MRAVAGKRIAPEEDLIERAVRVAGAFSSGSGDGSAHHDRHLAKAFAGNAAPGGVSYAAPNSSRATPAPRRFSGFIS